MSTPPRTPMVRKHLYLTRAQNRALKDRARRERRSEADVVREALERLLDGSGEAALAATVDDFQHLADLLSARHPADPQTAHAPRSWTRDDLYAEREARYRA